MKRHFETADDLKQTFNEYIMHAKQVKETPSLAGFAIFADTTTKTLYSYRNKEHPFAEIMCYVFDFFHYKWFNSNKLSDRMKEFMLKSHIPETYTERSIVTNNNINSNIDISEDLTDEQLLERIKQAKQKLSNLTPTDD